MTFTHLSILNIPLLIKPLIIILLDLLLHTIYISTFTTTITTFIIRTFAFNTTILTSIMSTLPLKIRSANLIYPTSHSKKKQFVNSDISVSKPKVVFLKENNCLKKNFKLFFDQLVDVRGVPTLLYTEKFLKA